MTFYYSANVVVTFSFVFQDYTNTLLNGVCKLILKRSKLIAFSKYRRRNHKLYFNGEHLEQVDEYTYLGVIFYRTGCLREAPLSLNKKASKASMSLLQALCKKNIPINILLKAFDTTVGPILTYGSEVWGSFLFNQKLYMTSLATLRQNNTL